MGRSHGHPGWTVAFVLVTLATLAASYWSNASLVSGPGSAISIAPEVAPATEPRAAATTEPEASPAEAAFTVPGTAAPTHLVVATEGASLTLAGATDDAPPVTVASGGARLEGRFQEDDELRLVATGEPGPWAVALRDREAWQVEVEAGAAQVRLELADVELRSLRVGAPLDGVRGSLPRSGRSEVRLGGGRSSLVLPRDSAVDARLVLGTGPALVQVDPGAHGRLELLPGAGPATLVVDATITVALALPPGDTPPLALEGTWWRYVDAEGVTWVRAPIAAGPDQAELTLALLGTGPAPLAVTYR